jgi:hypothetical protein
MPNFLPARYASTASSIIAIDFRITSLLVPPVNFAERPTSSSSKVCWRNVLDYWSIIDGRQDAWFSIGRQEQEKCKIGIPCVRIRIDFL